MSSRFRPHEELSLFDDLPLHKAPARSKPTVPPAKKAEEAQPESLSLFNDVPEFGSPQRLDAEETVDAVSRPGLHSSVPLQAYLSASLIDLGILIGVAALIWVGLLTIDVRLDGVGWGLLALFFLPFSFLYQVFPLGFWGCTPGMARIGLVARGTGGQALSFSQAGLRWTASVLTVLTLGLPLVLTQFTRRSLADRLSDSQTLPAR